jgi:CheY-like chemotaxis protein
VKRLLFVDDEPQILQGLQAVLYTRRKEWQMHFAAGAAQAIELMRECHFDVLVTDLRMPRVDGATLVARIRSDSPDTICIVLSAYADEDQSHRLVSLAHRYLSKPCDPQQLEECIDRCLATQSLIQSAGLRVKLGAVGALEAELQMGISHGVAGGYLLGLWGLPHEIVETVAHHENPAQEAHSYFDVLSAVSIAHALLVTIRPEDAPVDEMNVPSLGDEYLRAIRFPHSWESLAERARALLGAEESA